MNADEGQYLTIKQVAAPQERHRVRIDEEVATGDLVILRARCRRAGCRARKRADHDRPGEPLSVVAPKHRAVARTHGERGRQRSNGC